MKKALAALAFFALLPNAFAHNADVSHHGEYRLRYQWDSDANLDADTKPNDTNRFDHRFKYGLTFRAGEKLTGQLTLLHNAQWGLQSTAEGGSATHSTDHVQNQLNVQEAYGTWMVNDEIMIKAGRGMVGMGDRTVIAENDWQATPFAFEGILASYDTEFARFSGWGVKFVDTAIVAGSSDAEVNAWGFSADVKALPDALKMVHFHLIKTNVDAAANLAAVGTKQDRMRYGLTVKGDTAGFDYRLTYAANTGENDTSGTKQDISGNMIDTEFGYSMPDVMNMRIHLGFHTDTGQDSSSDSTEYNPYFYERHNNAGLMDVVGWGNLTYIRAGVSLATSDTCSVMVDYLMFTKTEEDAAHNNNAGTAQTLVAGESDIGSEIDLVFDKKYDDHFSIRTRLGMFSAGDAIGSDTDSHTQAMIQGTFNF